MKGDFASVEVLTAAEAKTARDALLASRRHWRYPGGDPRVGLLGLPSYELTGAEAPREYRERARRLNRVLVERFAPLYARLRAALEPVLHARRVAPLRFSANRARPGFHILRPQLGDADPRGWLGPAHWDGGFLKLRWRPKLPSRLDIADLASFTLPLALPSAGGGLRVWPVSSTTISRVASERHVSEPTAMKQLMRATEPTTHRYAVGRLFVHTGLLVHEVLRWAPAPTDERITLQGHALFSAGRWHLYW